MNSDPEFRLPALRAVDAILQVLQHAFSSETLMDGANPYRFNRNDPKGSRVWVCDPDSRVDSTDRDGIQMMVMVERGEYSPGEMTMNNYAGGNFSDEKIYTDLATTPVYIKCEAGSKLASETLASICYTVLKAFRPALMAEQNIHNLKLMGLSPSSKINESWLTVVSLRLATQEHYVMTELANAMNRLVLAGVVTPAGTSESVRAVPIATLDAGN